MNKFLGDIISKLQLNTIVMGFFTLIAAIVPLVYGNTVSRRKYSWVDVKNTYDEYIFYIKILWLEFIQIIIGVVVLFIPYIVISVFCPMLAKCICSVASIALIWCEVNKIKNLGWVKKEILGRKDDIYIQMPTIIANIIVLMFYNGINTNIIFGLLLSTTLFFEMYAMLKVYRNQYVICPYSTAEIYLDNQEKIICNDIIKMRRKRDVLIIENGKSEERICCNHILYIKYDGELVVKRIR